jgi:hypothetical protein
MKTKANVPENHGCETRYLKIMFHDKTFLADVFSESEVRLAAKTPHPT